MNPLFIILLLSILAGQLIKIPVFGMQAPPILDLIIIVLNLWGILRIKFALRKPPVYLKSALFFIVICIISLALTPLNLSSQEIFISFLYTVRFFMYILFGWLLYSGAFESLKSNITKLLICSGVGLAILGILQFIFLPNLSFLSNQGWDPHFYRTVSTFLDPNFAGAYFVLTLILLVQMHNPGLSQFQIGIGNSIIYLALLTTFSRSSYGMFLISFLTLSYFVKSWKMAFLSITLFFGLLVGFQIYSMFVAKPRNIDRVGSASFRLNTWHQGFEIFQAHPILGVGFNAYRYALKQYGLAPESIYNSRGGSTNDSSLLFVASTTGLLGLITYLVFLTSILIYGLNKNKYLTAALLGLIAYSTFNNSLFYPFILLWIILVTSSPKFLFPKGQKK